MSSSKFFLVNSYTCFVKKCVYCTVKFITYVKVTTRIKNFHQDVNKYPFLTITPGSMNQLSGSYNDYTIQTIIVVELQGLLYFSPTLTEI